MSKWRKQETIEQYQAILVVGVFVLRQANRCTTKQLCTVCVHYSKWRVLACCTCTYPGLWRGRGRRANPCGWPRRRTRASAGRTRPAPCGSPETRTPAGPPSGPSPRSSWTRRSRVSARAQGQTGMRCGTAELWAAYPSARTSGLKTSDATVRPSERRWLVDLALFRAIIAWRARRL